jgi:RNA polymerase sigma factor for flagellar operon FliA
LTPKSASRRENLIMENIEHVHYIAKGLRASRRENLIMENIEHVHYIAKGLQQRVRCVLIEDLVGAGTVALIQAVDWFDSSLGARFRSYASHRIFGAMLDYLREQDPIGRDERRSMRTVEGATGLTARTQPSTISLDGFSARALNTALGQSATRFPDVILRAELNEGRQALLPQEHRVIMLLFDLEWKGCDVARALGVTGGRISQIRRNAFEQFRSHLRSQRPFDNQAAQKSAA